MRVLVTTCILQKWQWEFVFRLETKKYQSIYHHLLLLLDAIVLRIPTRKKNNNRKFFFFSSTLSTTKSKVNIFLPQLKTFDRRLKCVMKSSAVMPIKKEKAKRMWLIVLSFSFLIFSWVDRFIESRKEEKYVDITLTFVCIDFFGMTAWADE